MRMTNCLSLVLVVMCVFIEASPLKTVLVTGGAGFLGSHLCKELLTRGYRVIALDNFYTGNKKNIEALFANERFLLLEHDIRNPIDIQVDYIFNLACPASPPHYQKDPIFTTETNVLGARNMLELAKKYNIPILQASTSEVYGDPEVHPQVETYRGCVNPIGIRACYDEGKRCAESLFFDYHRLYGISIKVVRIFNTYGPHMDPYDGRVISNFICQALTNDPITIYGNGTQTRSFCYVDDLINGMIALMFDSPQEFTGPVNLGNPAEYNLLELAQKIIDLTGSQSQIIFKPLPADDPQKRKPDIGLAKQVLNWQPCIDLDEGLRLTIDYFKRLNLED